MRVVFVGDKPSSLNLSQDVAFIGTPSFRNLCAWIQRMKVTNYAMVNSYNHPDEVEICRFLNYGDSLFVALGNNASKVLSRMEIPHFKLPHPSPKNRMLNNKKLIDIQLLRCQNYIEEQTNVYNLQRMGSRAANK